MSSAFESSIGLGQYAHLAAALDSTAESSSRSSKADAQSPAHGLATAGWFSADLVQNPLSPEAIPGPNVRVLHPPLLTPVIIWPLATVASQLPRPNEHVTAAASSTLASLR